MVCIYNSHANVIITIRSMLFSFFMCCTFLRFLQYCSSSLWYEHRKEFMASRREKWSGNCQRSKLCCSKYLHGNLNVKYRFICWLCSFENQTQNGSLNNCSKFDEFLVIILNPSGQSWKLNIFINYYFCYNSFFGLHTGLIFNFWCRFVFLSGGFFVPIKFYLI